MTGQNEEILPAGAKLTGWADTDTQRKDLFDKVKGAFARKFPQSRGGVKLEVADLYWADPERYSKSEQKEALMGNKFLHRRLRGKLRLKDERTGDVLEERETTMMRVPYLTERGTFVHNGSEYVTLRQARLQPGVYTRRKASGEMESHFNAKRGTGPSFRVRLEPESGLFKLDIGQSSLRLYSLLRDLGISDEDLEKRWGKDVLDRNREAYDSRVFDKAYERLVRRPDPNSSREQRKQQIKEALASTKLDPEVLQRTLPQRVNYEKQAAAAGDEVRLARYLATTFPNGFPADWSNDQLMSKIRDEIGSQLTEVDLDGMMPELIEQGRQA